MATLPDEQAAKFIPELWADALLKTYADSMMASIFPLRSRGAQLLRDAAIGHPEYGPNMGDHPAGEGDKFTSFDGGKANALYKVGKELVLNDAAAGKTHTISAGDNITIDSLTVVVACN